MPELHKAFKECKANLSHTALLVDLNPSMPLALVTDTSTSAMGALLQQCIQNAWHPLAIFSKKLNPAQQKYSAYDHELLAIYEAVNISTTCLKLYLVKMSIAYSLSFTKI
jgi:hypothetical protein